MSEDIRPQDPLRYARSVSVCVCVCMGVRELVYTVEYVRTACLHEPM